MRRGIGTLLVVWAMSACGSSPVAAPEAATGAASGTLVVVVVTGPERVPFRPKLARIQRANEQLAKHLGHSVQIEIDGALLPQGEDAAEDVLARVVETTAQDLEALGRWDVRALDFARATFERLVIRYSPSEAAAREAGWRRRDSFAKHEPGSKTVDVVRPKADYAALERGVVSHELERTFKAVQTERYANVLPEQLPRAERRAWFAFHRGRGGAGRRVDGPDSVTQVDSFAVLGMLSLQALARRDGDAEIARDTRKWLVEVVRDFASSYRHEAPKVEGAAPGSTFKRAEAAYIDWLRAELPTMSIEERGIVAKEVFILDWRTPTSVRDRFAPYAFPGLDKMAFGFAAIDSWIAAGHPPPRGTREVPALFEEIVCPVEVDTDGGGFRTREIGRCDYMFHRWVFADPAREDTFSAGVLARNDPALALAAFRGAQRSLKNTGSDYHRFLRRLEANLPLWKVGASLVREVSYRPDDALLEEARRLWRTNPQTRGTVLFWFARHAEVSYNPERVWPDLLQGTLGDESVLESYLDTGWEAFQLLPVAWPAFAKNGARARVIVKRARPLLDEKVRVHAGTLNVTGTLEAIARRLCQERALGELADLRAFATAELDKRPGAGLASVVTATEPSSCTPKPPARVKPTPAVRPPSGSRPDLFPPKPPLPREEW